MNNVKESKDVTLPLLNLFGGVCLPLVKGVDVQRIHRKTIPHGFVFDKYVYPDDSVLQTINKFILTQEKANNSFHKTWSKVKGTPDEELRLEQLIHYFTTYGAEFLGIKMESYVPGTLDVSSLIPFIKVIPVFSVDEIKDKIITLSSVALNEHTLNNIMIVIDQLGIDPQEIIDQTNNNELLVQLCDKLNITPTAPDAWLRYVIFKVTGSSMIIKNRETIDTIKLMWSSFEHDKYLDSAPKDLASIFLRNKKLFLAMKSRSRNKTFFNRLRKQANYMHKPLQQPAYKNIVTTINQVNEDFDTDLGEVFTKSLENASMFDLVKVINFCNKEISYITNEDSLATKVYRVRNGKVWVTDGTKRGKQFMHDLRLVHDIAVDKLLEMKYMPEYVVYIPEFIEYKVPTSEKQFVGQFPNYTTVTTTNSDMVVGVQWYNNDSRVDIDMSAYNYMSKVGWNGVYQNSELLFSGDMTDASGPLGASEMIRVMIGNTMPYILGVNNFTFNRYGSDKQPIELNAFIAKGDQFSKNHAIDLNNTIASFRVPLSTQSGTFGVFYAKNNQFKFILTDVQLDKSNVSKYTKSANGFMEATLHDVNSMLNFSELLENFGANVVRSLKEFEELKEADTDKEYKFVDLSPSTLDKTSLLELLK